MELTYLTRELFIAIWACWYYHDDVLVMTKSQAMVNEVTLHLRIWGDIPTMTCESKYYKGMLQLGSFRSRALVSEVGAGI